MSRKDDDKPDYEVGYKKPPKHSQFQKGKSGNPPGRPPNSLNAKTIALQELSARVAVTENGVRKKISKLQIALKQAVNKATSGDLKAIPMVLAVAGQPVNGVGEAHQSDEPLSTPADELVFQSLIKRVRASQADGVEQAAEAEVIDPKDEVGS